MLKPSSDPRQEIWHQAVRGLIWSGAGLAASRLFSLVTILILARLLAPSEFGQFGLIMLIVAYLETVSDLGINAALIYLQNRFAETATVAFWISITMGVLLAAVTFLLAPLGAVFFGEPAFTELARAMSFLLILNALGNTHDALLRQKLDFKRRFVPEVLRSFGKGLLAVPLAFLGWGVWSLVWGQLAGAALAIIVLWRVVPFRPKLQFPLGLAGHMLRYGRHIVALNFLSAFLHHADALVVGKLLGSAALGFYLLAYRIPELAISTLIWIVGKVTFPTFSIVKEDPAALRVAFLSSQRFLSLVTIPAGIGLAMLAPAVIVTLYGEKWHASIPILQALALSLAVRSLGSHAGNVYKAIGRPEILTKLALVRVFVLTPSLVVGANFGTVGVACAVLLVTLVFSAANIFIASKVMHLRLLEILSQFSPAVQGSVVMAAGISLAGMALKDHPESFLLMGGVFFGMVIYFIFTWFRTPETLHQILGALRSSFRELPG